MRGGNIGFHEVCLVWHSLGEKELCGSWMEPKYLFLGCLHSVQCTGSLEPTVTRPVVMDGSENMVVPR